LLYKNGLKLPEFGRKKQINHYLNCDCLISVGGGFINDNYRPAILGRLFNLYFAKLLKKPVIIYAQSVGPFNTIIYKKLACFVLNRVDLILLRDNKSREMLEKLGVTIPPIYVTADAAFSLHPHDFDVGTNLLRNEGFDIGNEKLKVSISVRKWNYYEKNNIHGHEKYIRSIASVADYLIEKKNAEVIFASTCTGFGGYHYDDRIVAFEVLKYMKNKAKILCGEYSPLQLSSIYGNMDLHIGTRMHSNILAMISGTPFIAIQYEFKTGGLMDSIGLNDFVVDVNHINSESLIWLVEKAINEKESIKQKILDKIPELRHKADTNAKLVFEFLSNVNNIYRNDSSK
jgi:colanic acid/amylovoran biosynthesis protein